MTIGDRPDTFARQLGSMVGQQQWGTWGGRLRGTPSSPERLPVQAQSKTGGIQRVAHEILVAPSNAPMEAKRQSHFVCDGVDDALIMADAADYANTLVDYNLADPTDPYTTPDNETGVAMRLLPGNFWFDSNWNPSGEGITHLFGTPGATVIHATDNFSQNGTTQLIRWDGTAGASTGLGWYRPIWMEGIVFNGGGFVNPATALGGIRVDVTCFMRDVAFVGCSIGCWLGGNAELAVLTDFLAEHCATGIYTGFDMSVLRRGTFTDNAIDMQAVSSFLDDIADCTFVNSGDYGGDVNPNSGTPTSAGIYVQNRARISSVLFQNAGYGDAGLYVAGLAEVAQVRGQPSVIVDDSATFDVDHSDLGAVAVRSGGTLRKRTQVSATSWQIVGQQLPTGVESLVGKVTDGTVTENSEDISVAVSSRWGWDGTTGDPYFNDAGVTGGEECELFYDEDTDEYMLRTVGVT